MSVKNTTATTKTHSLVELLEGRQLFSAAAMSGGMTPQADAKVAVSDFNFVMKVNKSSPELATTQKVRVNDIPITGKETTDGSIYGISFTTKVNKPSPSL